MGTKAQPGKYDCYEKAEPDEPMFVLLGRDEDAPVLVRLWARINEITGGSTEKTREALDCATQMEMYRSKMEDGT